MEIFCLLRLYCKRIKSFSMCVAAVLFLELGFLTYRPEVLPCARHCDLVLLRIKEDEIVLFLKVK